MFFSRVGFEFNISGRSDPVFSSEGLNRFLSCGSNTALYVLNLLYTYSFGTFFYWSDPDLFFSGWSDTDLVFSDCSDPDLFFSGWSDPDLFFLDGRIRIWFFSGWSEPDLFFSGWSDPDLFFSRWSDSEGYIQFRFFSGLGSATQLHILDASDT